MPPLPEKKYFSRNKITNDFLFDFESVREFFGPYYRNEEEVSRSLNAEMSRTHEYVTVAAVLKRQNEALGASEKTLDNITALATGESLCVVTGQQVGVLTGPLYTIYKAITAIKLAEHYEKKYGHRTIPVFWMASNDHDFDEISSLSILNSESEFQTLTYDPITPPDDRPVSEIDLEPSFDKLLHELGSSLPDSGFKKNALAMASETYKAGANLGECFGLLMTSMFSKYGLVLLDASDPEMMALAKPVYSSEVSNPLKTTAAINATSEKLSTKGYKAQLMKSAHSTGLFLHEEAGPRRPLSYMDGKFCQGGTDKSFTEDELTELLGFMPGSVTPNVFLRPVVQDFLLPTAAYVAGPSEVAYFAQLAGVYKATDLPWDMRLPLVFPRMSATLAEPQMLKLLDALGVSVLELESGPDKVFSDFVKKEMEDDIERLVENPAKKVGAVLEDISKGIADFDSGLRDAADPVRKRIAQQIEGLKKKIIKSSKLKQQVLREKVKEASRLMFPSGKPQERQLNVFSFLARYGTELIDKIYTEADIFSDEHQIIEL